MNVVHEKGINGVNNFLLNTFFQKEMTVCADTSAELMLAGN